MFLQHKLIKAMSNFKSYKKRFGGKEYHYHSLVLNMQVCFVTTQGHMNTTLKSYCTKHTEEKELSTLY